MRNGIKGSIDIKKYLCTEMAVNLVRLNRGSEANDAVRTATTAREARLDART